MKKENVKEQIREATRKICQTWNVLRDIEQTVRPLLDRRGRQECTS